MAIGVVLEFDGTTLEQYDQVFNLMGFQLGGPGPRRAVSLGHPTDGGIRVTDVRESRKRFERFAQEQIGPLTQQAGITSPPAYQRSPFTRFSTT